MERRAAKLTVCIAGLATACVLVTLEGALRVPVLEWWHHRRLESEDASALESAVVLARLGKPSAQKLAEALKLHRPGFRRQVVMALGEVAVPEDAAAVVLVELALAATDRSDEAKQTHWIVTEALQRLSFDVVPQLTQALCRGDIAVRSRAVEVLDGFGARATPAVPSLIARLEEKEQDLGWAAAMCLASIGEAAMPALEGALEDPRELVRGRALLSLGSMGAIARASTAAIARALRDPAFRVRMEAANTLGKIGTGGALAIPALVEALRDPKFGEHEVPEGTVMIDTERNDGRVAVARALGAVGTGSAGAVAALIVLLFDPNWYLRTCAAHALGEIGAAAESALPALNKAVLVWDLEPGFWLPSFPTRYDEPRTSAVRAIGKIGVASPAALEALAFALRSPSKELADAAREVVSSWGPSAAGLTGLLIEQMASDNGSSDCPEAASTLSNLGSAAVQALIDALANPNITVRCGAACALAYLRPSAQGAVTKLFELLKDDEAKVRIAALHALTQIAPGEDRFAATAVQALSSADQRMRSQAVYSVAAAGAKAAAAAPILRRLLAEPECRGYVPEALFAVTGSTPETIEFLIEALQDKNASVRSSAADALGRAGVNRPEILAALESALLEAGPVADDSDYYRVRESAGHSLLRLGPDGVRRVLTAAKSPDSRTRSMTARALGSASALSDEVISTLKSLLKDSSADVYSEARNALANVQAR